MNIHTGKIVDACREIRLKNEISQHRIGGVHKILSGLFQDKDNVWNKPGIADCLCDKQRTTGSATRYVYIWRH